MVYTAATLIFLTSVITLYALIINRKNPIMLVILIPMLLTSSAYTGYSIYALQGTPIVGLPVGKDVEIVWVEPAKPWIRLMLRIENTPEPLYYKVEYTDKNMEEINKAMAKAKGQGKKGAEGKFEEKAAGGEEKGGEFMFMSKPKSINPGNKNTEGNDEGARDDQLRREAEEERRRQMDELGIDSGHAPNTEYQGGSF